MAQGIGGTGLAAAFAASVQILARKVEVYWDVAVGWEVETSRCLGVSWDHALYEVANGLPVLGRGVISTASLLMDNSDNRFSPDYAGSPIHAYISGGIYKVPIRISAGYGADLLRQFTGFIESASDSETRAARRVTFQCRDLGLKISQKRHRSTLYLGERVDQIMATILTAGGITDQALDVAIAQIPFAWLDDENILEELSKLSQADGGMIHFSKEGQFRFWRMSAFLERSDSKTPIVTLTRGLCFQLQDAVSWRDVYDGIVVETTPREQGALTSIYQAREPIPVPPGQTVVHNAQYSYPVMSAVAPVVGTDYQALSAGGASLVVTLVFAGFAQQADLEFTNPSTYHTAYIVNLAVRGYPLMGAESRQSRQAGDKIFVVQGNPYLQTQAQQNRLRGFLNDRLKDPRRLWVYEGPLCPWLELGDRVTVTSSPHGISADAWVVAMSGSSEGAAQKMSLVLLPCLGLFPYTNYFILGTSSYADAASDRCFY